MRNLIILLNILAAYLLHSQVALADPMSWQETSTDTNAPSARTEHTAVWTGTEMLIFGGVDSSGNLLGIGGRYNPETKKWSSMNSVNAPTPRRYHVAVWTGTEMIIWGGLDSNSPFGLTDGAAYNPASDSWRTITPSPCPATHNDSNGNDLCNRWYPISGWYAENEQMIIWGGQPVASGLPTWNGSIHTYSPSSDTWSSLGTANAPGGRMNAYGATTGSRLIFWGGTAGDDNPSNGYLYDFKAGNWSALSILNQPGRLTNASAVWNHQTTSLYIWSGSGSGEPTQTGYRYNTTPGNVGEWTEMGIAGTPPPASNNHTAVSSENSMITWGGKSGSLTALNTGGVYDYTSQTWRLTPTDNAPTARSGHTAIWTGKQMIIWGGTESTANHTGVVNTGAVLSNADNIPGAEKGFTGDYAINYWQLGENPPGHNLIDITQAPDNVTLKNFNPWRSSGSVMTYKATTSGTVSFSWKYVWGLGQFYDQCPPTFILARPNATEAQITNLFNNSGAPETTQTSTTYSGSFSQSVSKGDTFGFALNPCVNPSGYFVPVTLKISDFDFQNTQQ
ncbi:MAG: hypothetical protein LRY66_07350 [Saccharospirillaceae bacterium]|nr:hypothetical protein [Saccharospirillaceae bacterium]MCD8531167.1 hypothetical protein [Saccharospirillaceae bacterium]